MYDMKALYQAKTVSEAVALRVARPDAQIIAGGSDVLVQMREGKRAGAELISIYAVDELRGVSLDEEENLRIGSLTSFSHITKHPLICQYINVLGEAVDQVGGPQIRNIGTIGGVNNPMPPEVASFMPESGGYASLFYGKVVDMLYFPLAQWTWPEWMPMIGGNHFIFFQPVFNIADAALSVGVIVMIIFYSKYLSTPIKQKEIKEEAE